MQLVPGIRAIVHDLDPTVPLDEPRTMTEVVSETLVLERMESWLFGIFASPRAGCWRWLGFTAW